MNKRLVYAALFGWLSWKFLLKTAITGYNLRYGMGGLAFVGYDGDSLVFDVGLDVKNPLPFDVMLYDADYINWRLTLAGTVSVDYLKNFPLDIDFTIEDFVKYIIPRPV